MTIIQTSSLDFEASDQGILGSGTATSFDRALGIFD
jgi:hypothetical protein